MHTDGHTEHVTTFWRKRLALLDKLTAADAQCYRDRHPAETWTDATSSIYARRRREAANIRRWFAENGYPVDPPRPISRVPKD